MGSVAISTVLAIATLLSVVGYGLVATRTLERSEAFVAEAQFDFTLARAGASIERSLHLGIPLDELEQSMPVLERTMDQLTGVLAADVFSADGVTLFSTDRGALGEQIPTPWQSAISERRGPGWRTMNIDSVTIGRPIANDFNLIEGWAAITVDRRSLPAPLTLAPSILRDSAPAIIAGTVFVFVAVLLALRFGLTRRRWEDIVAGRGQDRCTQLAGRAVARVRAAEDMTARAREEMQRLDAEV